MPSPRIRAFVALELPAPVRDALARGIAAARRELPGACAWTSPEKLHLTLAFLGASEPERLAALTARLLDLGARQPAFELRLAAPGAFPHARRPAVLWVGVEPSPALDAVQAQVATAAAELGWTLEARPFSAHLTCARVKQPGAPGALAAAWMRAPVEPVRWRVDALALMRSDTRPSGAVYTAISRAPLG